MSLINENFLELQDSYLFSTIAKKVAKFTEENTVEAIKRINQSKHKFAKSIDIFGGYLYNRQRE